MQACWVGHATLLVQLEGVTFLTDPVFSQRCSPVQVGVWRGMVLVALAESGRPQRCTISSYAVAIGCARAHDAK